MNNKIFAGLAIFISILLISTLFIFTLDIYYKSINSKKVSIEQVLEDDSLKVHLGIGNEHNPKDLGLSFTTVTFNSFDNTPLEAWNIPSLKPSEKCLIIAHDINSNRLEGIKYLKAFKKSGLLDDYHILMPDLRNAGVAGDGSTLMGYRTAEDIVTCMTLVKEQFNIGTFVLFGIGQGAIASAIALKRADLQKHLNNLDLKVSALILDSPWSNVSKVIEKKHENITKPIASAVNYYFNNNVDGYLDYMRLGFLLKKTDYETLILQNIGDEVTTTPMLLEELRAIPSVQLELFDGDEHARIILHPGYKQRYLNAIKNLLK